VRTRDLQMVQDQQNFHAKIKQHMVDEQPYTMKGFIILAWTLTLSLNTNVCQNKLNLSTLKLNLSYLKVWICINIVLLD
jgi:hypothetical protein